MDKSSEADEVAAAIVNDAVKLHVELGPGLLESVYEVSLASRLSKAGCRVQRQAPIAIRFDEQVFDRAFRADLLVNGLVIVEIKSVETVLPVHSKQVLTYLRLLDLRVGLLLNFGGPTMKAGLHRIVNRFVPSRSSRLRVNQTASPGAIGGKV